MISFTFFFLFLAPWYNGTSITFFVFFFFPVRAFTCPLYLRSSHFFLFLQSISLSFQYLGVSNDHESRLKIVTALTRKFRFQEEEESKERQRGCSFLSDVVARCPQNMTGADFYALCSQALSLAVLRCARVLSSELKLGGKSRGEVSAILSDYERRSGQRRRRRRMNEGGERGRGTSEDEKEEASERSLLDVLVSREDFEAALRGVTPSVSEEELRHYENLRKEFSSSSSSTDDVRD